MADCLDHQMGVVAYEVLGRGLFSGKYSIKSEFGENDTRSRDQQFREKDLERNIEISRMLSEVGARYGKSASQTAIRWVLDKSFVTCALVGAKTPAQVEENAGSLGWCMVEEDLERVNLLKSPKVLV